MDDERRQRVRRQKHFFAGTTHFFSLSLSLSLSCFLSLVVVSEEQEEKCREMPHPTAIAFCFLPDKRSISHFSSSFLFQETCVRSTEEEEEEEAHKKLERDGDTPHILP